MSFSKESLFLTKEVKREILSFLDSNFFMPIFYVGLHAFSEEEQALLKPIQKQLREDRVRLLNEKAPLMLADLDERLDEWRGYDRLLKKLGLPTTAITMRKMFLLGRFSEEPLPAIHYSFGLLNPKKSG